MTTMPPLVEFAGVGKSFGGVRAVEDTSLALDAGEVVAVLGHNGAGKSTLMKMLAGACPVDRGEIRVAGAPAHIERPADAQALGIETIHQTLALADNLDAVANLFLGREILTRWNTVDDYAMEAAARQVFAQLNPNFRNIRVPVRALSGGQRQVVAISREQWPLCMAALSLGGDIRVGLEDNFYLPSGEMAKSNGELVEAAVNLTKMSGRQVATVDEARAALWPNGGGNF